MIPARLPVPFTRNTLASRADIPLTEVRRECANLASSYWQAGRTTEAITLLERVLADRERLLGEEHPDTTAAADVA